MFDGDRYDAQASRALAGMADGLARTVCVARVLVDNGRAVDLAGLDRGVGLLCAKALDLPIELGRSLRPQLQGLLADVTGLAEALRRHCGPDGLAGPAGQGGR